MQLTRFAKAAWALVAYNLAVVAWGAYVRATGSGAGCGDHWPLCNGEVIPRAERIETLIEFSHRLSTGLDGIFIIGVLIWAVRRFEKGSPQRLWAWWTFILVLVEGGVGAGLVKYELVTDNASYARGVVMAAHLVTTFALLAAMTLMAWAASVPSTRLGRVRPAVAGIFAVTVGGMLLLGMSGAITALGDTLFPVSSFTEGLAQDLSPTAHLFVRLRIFHPVIAAVVGLGMVGMSVWSLDRWGAAVRTPARLVIGLVVAQMVCGMVNVWLAAPVWMQLLHLLLADCLWLALVVMVAAALVADGRGGAGELAA
jgi:heme A synthase